MKFDTVKAIVFDAYGTLFDVHSVKKKCRSVFPERGGEISQIWRGKQLEYSNLRSLMGRYRPFSQVTREALRFACKDLGLSLDQGKEEVLMEAYLGLAPYEEVGEVLAKLKGKHLAILSNGSHDMLDPLVEKNHFDHYLDQVISVDDVKQFKPTPAAYSCVLDNFPVKREEVLFLSSNPWDISGANNFGFHTAWVNRQNDTMDQMGFNPDTVVHDLKSLPALV
ncbi:MAG TPA: haloacid dehalogenase type II [Bacillales bacterium]